MWCHFLMKYCHSASSCWVPLCALKQTLLSKAIFWGYSDTAMGRISFPRSNLLHCCSLEGNEHVCLPGYGCVWVMKMSTLAGYDFTFWSKPSQPFDSHAFVVLSWAPLLVKFICFIEATRSDQKQIYALFLQGYKKEMNLNSSLVIMCVQPALPHTKECVGGLANTWV